jgi:hypothetical protein
VIRQLGSLFFIAVVREAKRNLVSITLGSLPQKIQQGGCGGRGVL